MSTARTMNCWPIKERSRRAPCSSTTSLFALPRSISARSIGRFLQAGRLALPELVHAQLLLVSVASSLLMLPKHVGWWGPLLSTGNLSTTNSQPALHAPTPALRLSPYLNCSVYMEDFQPERMGPSTTAERTQNPHIPAQGWARPAFLLVLRWNLNALNLPIQPTQHPSAPFRGA